MVICPVALAVGCRKCPIFAVCPVKSVIGDYVPPAAPSPTAAAAAKKTAKGKTAAKAATAGSDARRRSSKRKSN